MDANDFDGGTLADVFLMDLEVDKPADLEQEDNNDEVNNSNASSSLDVRFGFFGFGEKKFVKFFCRAVSNLRESEEFKATMRDIEQESSGDVDFELISRANELTMKITEHETLVSNFVRDLYAERFPELEGLIPDKMEYVRTVAKIKNEMDITKVDLDSVLPGHTCMIVRIGASTSDGKPLSEEKLQAVLRGCDEAMALEEAKRTILKFLESKMSFVAPNLSELVGTDIASQLVTVAGGLENLSKLSANAIRVLGMKEKNLMGLSTATQIQHVGILQQCEVLSNCPPSVKTQAIRVLAGRVALAARVDAQGNQNAQVTVGLQYKEEILNKIAKWQEPPPPRQIKALPVPKTGEGKTAKRGGELARRRKAKYKMTELRKQQNRLAFGEVKEEGLNDIMGADLGAIGTAIGGNKVKVAVEDTGILRGLSKKRKMEIAKAMEPGTGTRTIGKASHLALQSGMKSSLALEGDRGIELLEKAPSGSKVAENEGPAKYFGSNSGFAVPAPVKRDKK